jgi:hypothetical protein
MSIESEFLTFSADKLTQLSTRIETCLDKLTPEQIWTRHSDSENAIGNLVLHLAGNLRQWVISGAGGEPDVRKRDEEFAARGGMEPAELKERLRSSVEGAAKVLRSLPPARLGEAVSIQGFHLTVLAAIYHAVEHFSMHTGQIIFATKFLTGSDLAFYAHLRNQAHGEKTP